MNRPSLSLLTLAALSGLESSFTGTDLSGRRGAINYRDLVAPMHQGAWGVPWRSPASRGRGSVQNSDYLAGAWNGDGIASTVAKQKPRDQRPARYMNRAEVLRDRMFRKVIGNAKGMIGTRIRGDTVAENGNYALTF